jgi:hypothetical protein
MKRKLLLSQIAFLKTKLFAPFFLAILASGQVSGQLTITPGAQFSIFSDTKLTLQNSDLINNGNFLVATTSPVSFTGDASSFIAGDQAVRFFKLEINKTGNQSVSLHKTISVGSSVLCTAGFLDLNGFNLDLETSGRIDGESNVHRIVGANGGQVLLTTTLNAPVNVNPGNLGAILTSNQNLGQVTIRRGHQSQVGNGLSSSILRYYEILPANNTNLNATLRFNYFDGELNGINEDLLALFSSEDNINWVNRGFSSRSATDNFVTQTGINSFSRWTLSNGADSPLSVLFVLFNAKCEQGTVLLTWKTAQEQNSSHFDIEKSIDGIHWSVIGRVAAAGNSSGERNYSFADGIAVVDAQYRIGEYDLTGGAHYTSVIRSSCDVTDLFSLWPNPTNDKVIINIKTTFESLATIKLFDSKGALIKTKKTTVLPGNNQFSLDMASLPRGTYLLSAEWSNGRMKGVQVVKQ